MTGTDRQGVNVKEVGGPLTVSKGAEDFSLSFGFPSPRLFSSNITM